MMQISKCPRHLLASMWCVINSAPLFLPIHDSCLCFGPSTMMDGRCPCWVGLGCGCGCGFGCGCHGMAWQVGPWYIFLPQHSTARLHPQSLYVLRFSYLRQGSNNQNRVHVVQEKDYEENKLSL